MSSVDLKDAEQQVVEARERLLRRDHLQRLLAAAEAELSREGAALAGLRAELKKEGEDVQRLEGTSLAGLLHALRGTKEERLRREREEHLRARLRHDEAADQVASLRREAGELRRQIEELGDPSADHRAALDRKRLLLDGTESAAARQVERLGDRLAEERSRQHDLREIVAAGEALETAVDRVLKSLESAEGWGVLDVFAGGTLTSMIKHDRLDEARRVLPEAKAQMGRFRRALGELEGPELRVPEFGALQEFGDVWFDGGFTDLLVQDKIESALSDGWAARRRVGKLVEELRAKLPAGERRIATLEEELDRAVEAA
ncbi:MAG TPA: hypothetical protein VF263_00630 [Longimicrobiaceae bacterium]